MTRREWRESDLAYPVQNYLTGQGYTVRSEVKDCDITALQGVHKLQIDRLNFNHYNKLPILHYVYHSISSLQGGKKLQRPTETRRYVNKKVCDTKKKTQAIECTTRGLVFLCLVSLCGLLGLMSLCQAIIQAFQYMTGMLRPVLQPLEFKEINTIFGVAFSALTKWVMFN